MLASAFKGRSRFAALTGGVLISTTAWATTIDFGGLPGSQDSPFTSYTESGFTVAPLSGSWLVGQNFGHPPPFVFFKHPAVGGTTTEAAITVTDADTTFSFNSIDIYSSVTPVPYVFTGLLNGLERNNVPAARRWLDRACEYEATRRERIQSGGRRIDP